MPRALAQRKMPSPAAIDAGPLTRRSILRAFKARDCASAAACDHVVRETTTTIDATGFNLTYLEGTSIGAFDMNLLSDANGTVRIGLDLGLSPYTQNTDGGNGDFAVHQLLGAVRDGYRITSLTLSATLSGSLFVTPVEDCWKCSID